MRRTRCPVFSLKSRFSDKGSKDTPRGPLSAAAVPCPSTHPAAPLPASVLTLHTQGGCADRPGRGQAVAGEQGELPAPPPAQYAPVGHTWHAVALAKKPGPQDARAAGAQSTESSAQREATRACIGQDMRS